MAKTQSRSRQTKTQGLGSAALTESRKHLMQLEANRQAAGKLTTKERRAFASQKRRAKDTETRLKLAELRTLGFYVPRLLPTETRTTLTKSRRAAVNRAYRQLEALETGAVFAPYPTRNRKQRRIIQSEVRRQGGKVTRRGVFLPRSERELRQARGKLSWDKDTGLWQITVRKEFTGRDGVKHVVTEHRYLAGIEALEAQEVRLTKQFDKVKLAKTERIRFAIGGPQGNVSRRSFKSVADMMKYAKAYRKDARGGATFLASLTVFVVAKEKARSVGYDNPVAWIGKGGKRHDVSPELLGGAFKRSPSRKGKRGKRARVRGK